MVGIIKLFSQIYLTIKFISIQLCLIAEINDTAGTDRAAMARNEIKKKMQTIFKRHKFEWKLFDLNLRFVATFASQRTMRLLYSE